MKYYEETQNDSNDTKYLLQEDSNREEKPDLSQDLSTEKPSNYATNSSASYATVATSGYATQTQSTASSSTITGVSPTPYSYNPPGAPEQARRRPTSEEDSDTDILSDASNSDTDEEPPPVPVRPDYTRSIHTKSLIGRDNSEKPKS